MVAKPARLQNQNHQLWRSVVICLLIIIGLVSFTAFGVVHWVERQILTTENWVQVVAPLPKNNEVATSLSEYSVNQLLSSINLEAKITQALPDRASFLAPPLTEQVESRLTRRTKQIIQSDQFTTLWTAANRAASQRLLAKARGEPVPQPKAPARFNLDLSSLKERISNLLDKDSPAPKGDVSVGVNLKTSVDKITSYIKAADFLNGTLGLLALVSLLGGITLTFFRRRLVMVISIAVMVISLLQLIGAKALRPAVLNNIENASYRPAASAVYDTLLSSFKRGATAVLIVAFVLFLISWLIKPSVINRNKTLAKQFAEAKKSAVWKRSSDFRVLLRHYALPVSGFFVLVGLALMAFVGNLDWQGIIRSILFVVLAIEIVYLAAARPRRPPMKHAV